MNAYLQGFSPSLNRAIDSILGPDVVRLSALPTFAWDRSPKHGLFHSMSRSLLFWMYGPLRTIAFQGVWEKPCVLNRCLKYVQVAPVHWTHEDVQKWMQRVCKGEFASKSERVPRTVNGRALVRMTAPQLASLVGGSPKQGETLYDAIRNEIARVDHFMAQRRQEARETASRAKSGAY